MTEENMGLQLPAVTSEPGADPGNSEPEIFTEDLTADELMAVNTAVEETIQTLPVNNEGVL